MWTVIISVFASIAVTSIFLLVGRLFYNMGKSDERMKHIMSPLQLTPEQVDVVLAETSLSITDRIALKYKLNKKKYLA